MNTHKDIIFIHMGLTKRLLISPIYGGTGGSKYKTPIQTYPSGGVASAMVVKTYIYKTYIRHRRGHPIGTIDTTRDTINRNYSLQLT